MSGDVKRCKKS